MATPGKESAGCLKTGLIILIAVVVSTALTIFVLTRYVFPDRLKPVELSESEQRNLQRKLVLLGGFGAAPANQNQHDNEPEKYTEDDADRSIMFTERELNGLLADNTGMANRLAIDLSKDLASARLLLPIPEDFPIMPGRTLKVNAGIRLEFADSRPAIALTGVRVMGVPIPNAWLGGYKNVDLIGEFGDAGFWKAFADGVEYIRVEAGELHIRLKE